MRNAATLGFALFLAVLLLSAAVLWRDILQLIDHEGRVAHTRQVTAEVEAVRAADADAETGERGFLLTGDERFLSPYDDDVAALPDALGRLRDLVAGNPTQRDNAQGLADRIERHLARLADAIPSRRGQPSWTGDGQGIDGMVRAKAELDGIRQAADRMLREEERLSGLRDEEARASAQTALSTLAAVVVVAVGFWGLAYALVLRDRRRQERVAELVRQEREWLRVVLMGIGDGVIATDAHGRVTLFNPVARQLTGWKEAEAAGRPIAEVFPLVNEETRERVENPVERCLHEGLVIGLANHTVLLSRDGRQWPIDDSAGPIRSGERVVGAVLVFRDITERRRAEAERREQERRRERFLAVLGHELRHPLGPLVSATHLLGAKGGDPLMAARVRDMIERQTTHLTRLVDELLDAARVTQGKVHLQRGRLDLAALVRTTAEDRRAQVEAAGLTLTLELPADPVWVSGDAVRLKQVVENLMHNATKFTDAGGRLTVRLSAGGGGATLSMEDTGVGIPADVLPRLFEAFTQAGENTARGRSGLGLGLSVVKGMVELHGGRVRAHSDGRGHGATFTVWLPMEGAEGPAAGSEDPVRVGGGG